MPVDVSAGFDAANEKPWLVEPTLNPNGVMVSEALVTLVDVTPNVCFAG